MVSFEDGVWSKQLAVSAFRVAFYTHAFKHEGEAIIVFQVIPASSEPIEFRLYKLNDELGIWEHFSTTGTGGIYFRAASDSMGRIHATWDQPGQGDKYGVWENGTWRVEPAPFDGSYVEHADIAIGPDDRPYFAYTALSRLVHVVTQDPATGAWLDETVPGTSSGHDPMIGVGPDGTIHVATNYFTGSFNVPAQGANWQYHRKVPGGTWSTQFILPGHKQHDTDMALDGDGEPVIALPNSKVQTVEDPHPDVNGASVVLARSTNRLQHPIG